MISFKMCIKHLLHRGTNRNYKKLDIGTRSRMIFQQALKNVKKLEGRTVGVQNIRPRLGGSNKQNLFSRNRPKRLIKRTIS